MKSHIFPFQSHRPCSSSSSRREVGSRLKSTENGLAKIVRLKRNRNAVRRRRHPVPLAVKVAEFSSDAEVDEAVTPWSN
jgi:hypothetical protein